MSVQLQRTTATTADTGVDIANNAPISALVELGAAASDIKKLQEFGVTTVLALVNRPMRDLSEVKGVSENKLEKLVTLARTYLFGEDGSRTFCTAADVDLARTTLYRVDTGVPALNEILGGGYEVSSLTELFGEAKMGKSQLAHQACASLAARGLRSVYIDTENSFRPERIKSMCESLGADPDAALHLVSYARAHNHEHQLALLQAIATKIASQFTAPDGQYRLVVIDSVTALFRSEFTGRGQLSERQQILGRYLAGLHKLSEEYQVAVLMTNQVCADPGGAMSFASAAAANKPIGGNILAHASTTRISLRRGKAGARVAKIFDSPVLPEAEAAFMITPQGLQDAAE